MNRSAARLMVPALVAISASGALGQIFSDDFDSYKTGSNIAGQGGWETWCTGGADATLSDAHARSDPNALRVVPASDIVQRFNETSGQLVFSFYVYVPSSASGGSGSINLMNSYCEPFGWSVSTTFNPDTGLVTPYVGQTTALIEDQWVQYRAEIDLDNDILNEFYGDTQIVFNALWTNNISPGPLAFLAADFYSDNLSECFFDNVVLERAGGPDCYPDCDGDQELSFFDFLCFTNAFNAGDMYADCDGDKELSFFDFLCFTNNFNAGC